MFAAPLQTEAGPLVPRRRDRVRRPAIGSSGARISPDYRRTRSPSSPCSTPTPYPALHLRRRQRAEQPPLRHRAPRRQRRPPAGAVSSATSATAKAPASTIPYRIDVWRQSAPRSGSPRTPSQIELAPALRDRRTLGQLPPTTSGPAAGSGACPTGATGPAAAHARARQARILPSGLAAAPQDAPAAVKDAIAAGNQIDDKPYSVPPGSPAAHYGPLAQLWPAYDCSGAVSYLLYKIGRAPRAPRTPASLSPGASPGPGSGSPSTPAARTPGSSSPASRLTPAPPARPSPGSPPAPAPAGDPTRPGTSPTATATSNATPPAYDPTTAHISSRLSSRPSLWPGAGSPTPTPTTQCTAAPRRPHHEPTPPPARSPIPASRRRLSRRTTAASGVTAGTSPSGAATPRQALRLYARLYINWTATTHRRAPAPARRHLARHRARRGVAGRRQLQPRSRARAQPRREHRERSCRSPPGRARSAATG